MTIQDIKNKFGIESDDCKVIKRELLKILANTHPDNNNGEFPTKEDEDLFLKASDALKELQDIHNKETDNNNSLQEANTMPTMLLNENSLSEILTRIVENNSSDNAVNLDKTLSDRIYITTKDFQKKYLKPKITTASISGLLTILLALPTTIENNSFYKQYINFNNHFVFCIWVLSIVITIFTWLRCYIIENEVKDVLEKLKIESLQNSLFKYFAGDVGTHFSKSDFIDFVVDYFDNHNRMYRNLSLWQFKYILFRFMFRIRSGIIDLETAQYVAEIILNRALNKGVIKRMDVNTIDDFYEILPINKIDFSKQTDIRK